MKKMIALLLSVCMIFLFGCTQSDSTERSTVDSSKDNTTSNTTMTDNNASETQSTTAPTAKGVASLDSLSTSKVVWGPGIIKDHKQPADPVDLQKKYYDIGGRWLLNDKKSICLTFDEGYENGYTPSILDTLKEKGVKAIFFVTYDFAKDNPELIKRMIDEGHVVGNHTYRHYTMDEVSLDVAKQEVVYLHNYIKKNFDYTMSYFRFPKGEFSQQSLYLVNTLGYKSVFWSYAYADWDPESQPEENSTFTSICESTHPGEIMLLHAVSKTNANILGKVIDDCEKQGYTFTTKVE